MRFVTVPLGFNPHPYFRFRVRRAAIRECRGGKLQLAVLLTLLPDFPSATPAISPSQV
jgi:hypothetical protein